ncbi:MAG: AAA domain-containing protein, partial [Candidatus Bathyarchaeota archaeon]
GILKEHLTVPFVQKLEQPLETLSLGDENIAYLMEEELTAVLIQLMEGTISETLKNAIAGEEVNARDNLRDIIQAYEVKSTVNSFFESFQVFDVYNEVYEMSRNKAILDKQEFYLYFCDITYSKVKYPVFYIPFTIEKSGDAMAFEFDSQLYINKKALEYITQQYNEERGKFGSLKSVSERIIYLARYDNNLGNALQLILDELTDFFELDSRVNVNKPVPQVAKGLFTRITNSCYFALFDKADEALVNDYEMILQLLAQGDNTLAVAFNKLIEDFIHENPTSCRIEIADEWDNKDVPDKLVFRSPIPLNSEQLQIVAALRKKDCKYVTVEGPPGTGKSHTITAIAFNAIMDNQNVLILSDKKEALDVVEDKITEAMNKVRIDKNFQNPILRLGKTGSTYSQILSNASMSKINLHHRAVKKEHAEIENSIQKLSNTLRDELENEIARCGDIDLREVYEMISMEREYEAQDQLIDLVEVLGNPDSVHELEEFRKIFLSLKEILTTGGTRELLKLLRVDLNTLKDLHGLLQASELATELANIITFLVERYGSRIEIVTKFKSFTDEDLNTLSLYIMEYNKVSGLLATLFKRGKIKQLNNNFKNDFPFCGFEEPRKCIEEIKEIHEIFWFSFNTQKKQMKVSLPPGFDFCNAIYSVVENFDILTALEALMQVSDDLKYLGERLSRYEQTFKKIGFEPSSFKTYFDNRLTHIEDIDFDRLLQHISLKQKIKKQFGDLPFVNYANRQKTIEDLVTVQMTYIMDKSVIDFFDDNRADAAALREVIKKKERFPQDQFQKLKKAFPCILSGIRDYAEYIPLEPDIFDLLIIDEASQVSIAQTFPALLRAKKVLILGDRKQFSNVKAA